MFGLPEVFNQKEFVEQSRHLLGRRSPVVRFMAEVALLRPIAFPPDSKTPAVTTWATVFTNEAGTHVYSQACMRTVERTALGKVHITAQFEENVEPGGWHRTFAYILGSKHMQSEGGGTWHIEGVQRAAFNSNDRFADPVRLIRGINNKTLIPGEPLSVLIAQKQLELYESNGGQDPTHLTHLLDAIEEARSLEQMVSFDLGN